jgi:hypothetical protein
MQSVCTDMLKEGVIWDKVHLTAHEIGKASLSFFHRTHRSQQAVKKRRLGFLTSISAPACFEALAPVKGFANLLRSYRRPSETWHTPR